jgi:hypothetical protein
MVVFAKKWLTFFLFIILYIDIGSALCFAQQPNPTKNNRQTIKFTKLGDAIDAHDGEITYFNGTYYLYGTSYGCGFEWGHKDAPFCGFKVYTSKDLENWVRYRSVTYSLV